MQSIRRFMAKPFRFVQMDEFLSREQAKVLDVGCGNHSPRRTKKYYPDCRYFGLDRCFESYIEAADLEVMERFYEIDLTNVSALDDIPDDFFDCVIMSHVIEHLPEAEAAIAKLCGKVAVGGGMYVETPSAHSVRLPHMSQTLNFHDDPTHVRLYDVRTICKALESGGLTIRKAAVRRDWRGIVLIPYNAAVSVKQFRRLTGPVFWDLCGFASYVVAIRPTRAESPVGGPST